MKISNLNQRISDAITKLAKDPDGTLNNEKAKKLKQKLLLCVVIGFALALILVQ